MKSFLFILMAAFAVLGFQSAALADYATTPQPNQPYYPSQPGSHYGPYPYPYPAPAPAYPPVAAPYVMCFAQGLANGALFYGVGLNVYSANQWAMYACNMSGQYCQLTGCRY